MTSSCSPRLRRRVRACLIAVVALSATTPAVALADTPGTATGSAGAAVRYRYVQIAPIAANVFGRHDDATDVNTRGQVVGNTSVPQSNHAFVSVAGRASDIGTLGSDATDPIRESSAHGINTAGVVVGSSQLDGLGDTGQHAYRWKDGVFTDLGTGYTDHRSGSYANDVNDSGLVVGVHYSHQSAPKRAVVWSNGRISELPDLGGVDGPYGTTSEAVAVNSAGVIAGYAVPPEGAGRAVIWQNGKLRELGTLGGTSNATQAFGINDLGVVVGTSPTADGTEHAFRWRNGTMTDLGNLPVAAADIDPYAAAESINSAGVTVGLARISPDQGRTITAAIWHGNRLVDLNTLVDDLPNGFRLELASSISDDGRIVGRSCLPARCYATSRAYELIPVTT